MAAGRARVRSISTITSASAPGRIVTSASPRVGGVGLSQTTLYAPGGKSATSNRPSLSVLAAPFLAPLASSTTTSKPACARVPSTTLPFSLPGSIGIVSTTCTFAESNATSPTALSNRTLTSSGPFANGGMGIAADQTVRPTSIGLPSIGTAVGGSLFSTGLPTKKMTFLTPEPVESPAALSVSAPPFNAYLGVSMNLTPLGRAVVEGDGQLVGRDGLPFEGEQPPSKLATAPDLPDVERHDRVADLGLEPERTGRTSRIDPHRRLLGRELPGLVGPEPAAGVLTQHQLDMAPLRRVVERDPHVIGRAREGRRGGLEAKGGPVVEARGCRLAPAGEGGFINRRARRRRSSNPRIRAHLRVRRA